MADEGWNYARTDGAPALATTDDAAELATSATSTDFQPASLHDGAASCYSFLANPHMDWTQTYMAGRTQAVATTSFNAFLQLRDDVGGRFLPDHTPPHEQTQYPENQCSNWARNCSDMRAAAMMKPFPQQEFSGSSQNFGLAAEPPPPLILPQVIESKLQTPQVKTEGVQEGACSTVKRKSSVPNSPAVAKKLRIQTPSPLPQPIFKVRKEKLGDRITALQQLVSPFGKTDTASVLHEAIEYIKFLHDQIVSLSSPYLRSGRAVKLQQQQVFMGFSKAKNGEAEEDLRSRGLCLVPLASTYAMANETALEFWHPTFRGAFL
ncbi:hypothetical protein QOZ80_5AG0367700 [Eleusine coracana subsp. coracana]|nr:hypothetical protein QOZ80_5AG0367700 [Eleusine coracana subsp. coracana]